MQLKLSQAVSEVGLLHDIRLSANNSYCSENTLTVSLKIQLDL